MAKPNYSFEKRQQKAGARNELPPEESPRSPGV